MDGLNIDLNDSDSGDSWTLLDHTPSGGDASDFPENCAAREGYAVENNDKDEDTDGISIISDSEGETAPCEQMQYDVIPEQDRPTETDIPQCVVSEPQSSNNSNDLQKSMKAEDFLLGDNNSKMRTYVHRRNKRLSTVLNIIVLGSIITAAGVAIGHMWGIKDDCSVQSSQSINKILSNLYKLQEENAYLRNKLRELTLINNLQTEQQKFEGKKLNPKHQFKCKKVFEESLDKKNVQKITQCLDDKTLEAHLVEPDFEKDYLNDLTKLKKVYRQNKSLLDDEVSRRLKFEENAINRLRSKMRPDKNFIVNNQVNKTLKDLEKKVDINIELEKTLLKTEEQNNSKKKISYAESLKSGTEDSERKKLHKRNISQVSDSLSAETTRKKKSKKDNDTVSEKSISEDVLKKDDRYMRHKYKVDRKKNDRQKILKKQKRKNKYEQWEMKGGYLKDYDDFSVTSSQENSFVLKNPDKNFQSRDFEKSFYIDQFSDSDDTAKKTEPISKKRKQEKFTQKNNRNKSTQKGDKVKDSDWFEKRATMRSDARKKLEHELFGDSTPNNAAWYFRRMQKREQCRVKSDGNSHRKTSKRGMNFKTKQ